ncbi:unnamed protein product [Brassica oleracea var. botrytis]|uniref:Transcription factor TFIIIC triple barrel domain-containing protein n=1 Tax=Brassica oleracea TaxID=3712 RepID=A0A3P6E2N4_BRAOL|nr:unnamed protein product [Brassica oleracea]
MLRGTLTSHQKLHIFYQVWILVLTIDSKIKLVGKYLETIGTCLAFSDKEVAAADNQTPHKTVEPVAKLHKILKFRLALDNVDGENTRSTSL